jgi:predicted glycosyltransferase
MRILLDIGHPAHVHYFKNLIWEMQKNGHEFLITARDRKNVFELLDAYGFKYVSRGKGSQNLLGKILYLPSASLQIYDLARSFKPNVFLSFASPYAALASKLYGRPHIAFDDTEVGRFEQMIYLPLTDVVCTPSFFKKDFGKKHRRFNGFMELCYLHPSHFRPDPKVLQELGVGEKERYFVVRFVSWEASHDVGEGGINFDSKKRLIGMLSRLGRVFISSETQLPPELEKYCIPTKTERIHHVLAFASLYFGESPTMTTESALLGTPAICVNSWACDCGNFKELSNFGLIDCFPPSQFHGALECANEMLSDEVFRAGQAERTTLLLNEKTDVTAWMVELVESYYSPR